MKITYPKDKKHLKLTLLKDATAPNPLQMYLLTLADLSINNLIFNLDQMIFNLK